MLNAHNIVVVWHYGFKYKNIRNAKFIFKSLWRYVFFSYALDKFQLIKAYPPGRTLATVKSMKPTGYWIFSLVQ